MDNLMRLTPTQEATQTVSNRQTIEMRDTFTPGVNTTFRINDGHNTGWFECAATGSRSFGFGIVNAGAAVGPVAERVAPEH